MALGALALVACGDADGEADFGFDRATDGSVAEVSVLRLDREAGTGGMARVDADILLPPGLDEPSARATLSYVIDSLAAADTMVAAIRVTGFVIGRPAPGATEAPVEPVIQARWVPTDTVGVTGSNRRARYRTHFVILAPLTGRAGGS